MSIVTLKKKAQAKYNNMSVSHHGFSLNGTLRNQGYVGQTSLARSIPVPNMRGNTVRGHGGCCGTFRKMPIIQSETVSTNLNNSNVIKTSVLNTLGMIDTKYKWITRPQPYAVVKPDNNNHNNFQSDYISNLSKLTIQEANACQVSKLIGTGIKKCSNPDAYFYQSKTTNCTYTKPESNYLAMSYGDYLIQFDNSCTLHTIPISKNTKGTPFAGSTPN